MATKQIMLVGLDPTLHELDYLFSNDDILFHLAEETSEAVDMAMVTTIDMIVVNRELEDEEILKVSQEAHEILGNNHIPFVFLYPDKIGECQVVAYSENINEYKVTSPGLAKLPALLDLTIAHNRLALAQEPTPITLEEEILHIGFSETFQANEKELAAQTEISTSSTQPHVRSRIYDGGQIVLARSKTIDVSPSDISGIRSFVADFHQESINEAKQKLD